jgi:hypothetical protein
MVRSVTTKAKQAISDAAQRSGENVRSVAGDAFSVAAKATDVVVESTTNALAAGQAKLRQSTPAMKRAIGMTVNKPRRRKKVTKKKVARKKTTWRRKAKRRARR